MPATNQIIESKKADIGEIRYRHEPAYRTVLVHKIGELSENICHVEGKIHAGANDGDSVIKLDLVEKDIFFFRALNDLLKKNPEDGSNVVFGRGSHLGYYVDDIVQQYIFLKNYSQYETINGLCCEYENADEVLTEVQRVLNIRTKQFLEAMVSNKINSYDQPAMYKALDTVFLLLEDEKIQVNDWRLQIAPKVPTIQKALTTILGNMEDPRKFSSWKDRWISTKTGEQTNKLLMLQNLKIFAESNEGQDWLKKSGNEEKLASVVAAVCQIKRYSISNLFKKSNDTHSYDEFQREYANHTDFKLPDNNQLTKELRVCLTKKNFNVNDLLGTVSNKENDAAITQINSLR